MIELSKRLRLVADYIPQGAVLADIGSDHALLPVYMLQSGKISKAIAGEVNPGPFQAAQKAALSAGLADRLSVRRGDGLAVLEPGEADVVSIAGMGGALMSSILEAGRAAGKLEGVSELVLQPNIGEDAVRVWLLSHNWYLEDENILEEDGKTYEVLHAVRDEEASLKNEALYDGAFLPVPLHPELKKMILIRMGPHLLRQPTTVLTEKWQSEIIKLERIWGQMAESSGQEALVKREQFRKEIDLLKEVLDCLPTDKPSFR
ncbi:tRNA (adenine(22)-N(1))-methyltransferase [Paenibacillus sp. CAU 1782]